MTAYRITYEGPPTLAVATARMLAEADGVELTASRPPEPSDAAAAVVLSLTVTGTSDAVLDAVQLVRTSLPEGASLTIER